MPLLKLTVSFALALLFGFLFCDALFQAQVNKAKTASLKWFLFFLGGGVGIGLYSLFIFIWLITFGFPNQIYFLAEFLLPVILAVFLLWIKKSKGCFFNFDSGYDAAEKLNKRYAFFFCLISILSLLIFSSISYKHPHGAWDAWAHWNFKARFIFRSAEHWKDVFRPEIYLIRPVAEHPFLLPCAVARAWTWVGYDSALVPIAIAFTFTFCTVGLLASGVWMLKGKNAGLLSAIFLLSVPEFIRHGASQFADIEAAFFLLATIMILVFYDASAPGCRSTLVLAGMTAGLACWVKNEGLFFSPAVLIARALSRIREVPAKTLAKEAFYFLLGLLPVLFFVFYLKRLVAIPHLFLTQLEPQKIIKELFNPVKYPQITKAMIGEVFNTDNWFIYPILMPIYLFLRGFAPIKISHLAIIPLLTLVFILLIEFCIYLILPTGSQSLTVHLMTSLSRLYFQLWPLALACFFILLKPVTARLKGQGRRNYYPGT